MGEHRERVDKRMSAQFNHRVLVPLALNLGARYIRDPYLGAYDDAEKTLHWGLGHKKHGDKRHRTRASYVGIYYGDGGSHEGQTREIVTDKRLAWARKHDNRLAQNEETFGTKEVSPTTSPTTGSGPSRRSTSSNGSPPAARARSPASAARLAPARRRAYTASWRPSSTTRKRRSG